MDPMAPAPDDRRLGEEAGPPEKRACPAPLAAGASAADAGDPALLAVLQEQVHRVWAEGPGGSDGPSPGRWLLVKVLSDPSCSAIPSVGARLWPASLLLAELLLRPAPLGLEWAALLCGSFAGGKALRVLELGAGTALPSVCLALAGHSVVATDLEEVIAVARANVEANRRGFTGTAEAVCLPFGDESAAQGLGEFDLVIGSDIAYDPSSFEPLLETLRALRGSWWALLAISERPEDLGEETFENLCRDEKVPLRLRYTALPPGLGAHRVNVYEIRGEALLAAPPGDTDA